MSLIASKICLKNRLYEVSLSANSQQIIGLLGPNGAGKTTFIRILAGLLPCDSGQITINNKPIAHMSLCQRALLGLGYLPQDSSIFRGLTVKQNILCGLHHAPDHTRNDTLHALLEQFKLTDIQDTLGEQLSGGERRRTEIARIMAIGPTVLLLDEPFAGIDPISVQETKQWLLTLKQQNIAIIITDHNAQATLSLCDHIIMLDKGHIMAQGSAPQLLKEQRVIQNYLGSEFIFQTQPQPKES